MTDADEKLKDLLREEIEELTDLLRNDEDDLWTDLQESLRKKGFDPATSLLVSYVEDEEDGTEYGVLVTPDRRVIEFQRNAYAEDEDSENFVATDITNDPERLEDYPQVPVALAEFF